MPLGVLAEFARTTGIAAMGQRLLVAGLDWSTAATLATAVGTLVLAVATFASVRSANRAARVAEAAFQSNLRPVLVTSRIQDPMQKLRWADDHWVHLDGGQASAELVDGSIYLAISVRNVGSGLAVPIGWSLNPQASRIDIPHDDPKSFRPQTRDLYVAPSDMGFWHAAIRERDDRDYGWLSKSVTEPTAFSIELLYGDAEGGQRTISRFGMIPVRAAEDTQTRWYPSVARHWNLDRPDPR